MLQLSGHTSLRGQAAVLLLILSQNYRFLPEAKAQPGERGGFLLGPWEGQTNILRWRKGSEMSLPSPGPLLTKTCRCDQCLGDQGPPSIDRKSWGPERAVACPGSNSAEMAELVVFSTTSQKPLLLLHQAYCVCLLLLSKPSDGWEVGS